MRADLSPIDASLKRQLFNQLEKGTEKPWAIALGLDLYSWFGLLWETEKDEKTAHYWYSIPKREFFTIADFVNLCHSCEHPQTSINDLIEFARPLRRNIRNEFLSQLGTFNTMKIYGLADEDTCRIDSYAKRPLFRNDRLESYLLMVEHAIQHAEWRYYDQDSWIRCRNI